MKMTAFLLRQIIYIFSKNKKQDKFFVRGIYIESFGHLPPILGNTATDLQYE